ncbi:hypothetical protein [Saccharospirillum salsuginis]|uniref:Uncharacterized protein n=1 Tax=Saccharospirillum salsuginis TaxID=418750 RepID=A0A918K940_9GAMM|nr:hypothetical protein [Saccharospirillum salsuginis]GGX55603.1 hypothetical protein GCM10007392_24110 [Saccharospirillum salsuginis]
MNQHLSDPAESTQSPVATVSSRHAGARLTLGFYLLSRHALSEWCNE